MAFLDCHWCKLSGIFGFCLLLLVALGPFQESSQVGIVDPVWGPLLWSAITIIALVPFALWRDRLSCGRLFLTVSKSGS